LNNLSEIKRLEYFYLMYSKLGVDAITENSDKRALYFLINAIQNLDELCLEIAKNNNDKYEIINDLKIIAANINKRIFYILNKLGDERCDAYDYVTAIVYYEEALKINPQDANTYNTIGYMYKKISTKYENLDKQIEYYEKAIELAPDHLQAVRNLALAYPLVGRIQEAIKYFHKLFELGPVIDDYVAYSYLKIQLGDFKEGWKHYEHRFYVEGRSTEYPKIDKPLWKGQKIQNKTLLVHYEQGFGDTIQFFRYLEQVKPLSKKIIFRVQNTLVDLIKMNTSEIEVVGMSTPLENLSFDYQIPLMSLPHVLNATIDNIPFTEGNIKADKIKEKDYKEKYFDNDCLKIGISWNGAKGGNFLRDIPLDVFYPLTKIKNVKVYSFQKNFGSEQLEQLPPDIEIIDMGKTFNDFSDTAAAMANLDLFVTSDNGVFNLAATMGVKTFLFLNKNSEWRWFFDEDRTPWYDSVRIFKKQNENDDWKLLMQRVIDTLIK